MAVFKSTLMSLLLMTINVGLILGELGDPELEDIVTKLIEDRMISIKEEHVKSIHKLEEQLKDAMVRLDATENQVHTLARKLEAAENKIQQYTHNDDDANTYIEKRLLNTITSTVPSVLPTIAFSSTMSTKATELGNHHTIPFDQTVVNEGGGFDELLHVFTCPVDGVYMFMTALLADIHENTVTEIVRNGTPLVAAYSAGSTAGHGYDQGFNSAITKCLKGDRVWVQIHNHQGTTVFGRQYCSFSGYLVGY